MKSKNIACITVYEKDSILVRATIVINRIDGMSTEKLLTQEDWIDEKDLKSQKRLLKRLDQLTNDYVAKAAEHDAEIHMIEEPMALEECDCGTCSGYLTNEIRAEDVAQADRGAAALLH